jgi:hypothetical protein
VTNGRKTIRPAKPIDLESALVEALDSLAVIAGDRALIGGVALVAYGIERYTKDIDLAVTVAQAGVAETALADHDLRPLRIGGVSFATSSGVRVDLVDHRFTYKALYEEAIREAMRDGPLLEVGSKHVQIVPLPYLAAMKLVAARPQDEADLHRILKIRELDYARTRAIVLAHAGDYAAKALDKLARGAGRGDTPRDYEDEYGPP